jgi:hypothetical protein
VIRLKIAWLGGSLLLVAAIPLAGYGIGASRASTAEEAAKETAASRQAAFDGARESALAAARKEGRDAGAAQGRRRGAVEGAQRGKAAGESEVAARQAEEAARQAEEAAESQEGLVYCLLGPNRWCTREERNQSLNIEGLCGGGHYEEAAAQGIDCGPGTSPRP